MGSEALVADVNGKGQSVENGIENMQIGEKGQSISNGIINELIVERSIENGVVNKHDDGFSVRSLEISDHKKGFVELLGQLSPTRPLSEEEFQVGFCCH